ncbi:MAG TPA: hypothetical protein DHW82_12855 [Spirochaetia bacterium]|nr:MAG: hypothetical protein A2Y41_03315 [Spirochaetes bacterium GWB1_36_13]HCL57879.1 hypothetical protein [Spirochaetia bacterium]
MQRQILIIKLDGDLYGIDVRLIKEVIKKYTLREIPDAPNFIEGVISLRDDIVPLIKIKRILNMPMFDLYKHKKVIILYFGEGVKIGIVVDDVLGIHYYDDQEIQPVDTVSRSEVINYVLGVIKNQNNQKIAILDVLSMFFTNKGDFLYKNFLKNGDSKREIKILKKDYFFLKEKIEKNKFPFNAITQNEIIKYVSKISTLKGKKIEEILKDPKFFETSHFDLEQTRTAFFENISDMYMITEAVENFIKRKKDIRVWLLGNATGEDAYSIAMIFHSFEIPFKNIRIISSNDSLEKLVQARKGVYKREAVEKIPQDLVENYFLPKDKKEYYIIKDEIKKSVVFDFFKPNSKFQPYNIDLIYAPNYLSKNTEKSDLLLKNFYKALNPDGILALGLFENIEGFAKKLKKYYIKNRLVFIKES